LSIITLNFHYGNNYGAVLQAYALQQSLKKYSDEVESLDFVPEFGYSSCLFRIIKKLSNIKNINNNYKKIKSIFLDKNKKCSKELRLFDQKSYLVFDDFRKNYLNITDQRYKSISELYAISLANIEAIVCGSDVIWGISDESLTIEAYFLSWVSQDVLKIAYAPSWGSSDIEYLNQKTKNNLTNYLSTFHAISVREKSGSNICLSLGLSDVQWVPDPTMLLTINDWDEIADSFFDEYIPYILNYHIPYNNTINDEKIFHLLNNNFHLQIVNIPDIESEDTWITPTKWLGAIRNAKFVVTNSFHGVVFCLLYHKSFIFKELVGHHAPLNERVCSLLNLFKMGDRIVSIETADNISSIQKIIEKNIDWEFVDQIMIEWRQVGIDFLDKAFMKVPK